MHLPYIHTSNFRFAGLFHSMLAQNGIGYKNSHSGEPLWLLTVLRPPAFGAEGFLRGHFWYSNSKS